MKIQYKNGLMSVLGLILVGAVFIYVSKDSGEVSIPETRSDAVATTSVVSVENLGQQQGFKIENISSSVSRPVTSKKPLKMPDLSRPIVNYSHIEDGAFAIASENILSIEKDLKRDATSEQKWLQMGIYRKMLGDYPAVIEILNFVTGSWPTNYIGFNNLADIYQFYSKDYPLAEKNWLKVIELKPDSPEAYKNLYSLYSTYLPGQESKALPIILAGLKANPKSTELMVYVARHYKRSGDKASSLNYYNQAVLEAQAEKNQALESSLRSEISEISM